MSSHDEFVRILYRGSIDWPLVHFQEAALDTVADLISFDSAMWGLRGGPPDSFVEVHLDRQPKQMLDAYLANFQHEDLFSNAARSQLGKVVNLAELISCEAYEKTRFYREFASHWGMRQALSTFWVEPISGLIGIFSLWRKSPLCPFSEQERAELECLIPHLAESHRLCRIITMRQTDKAFRQAVALCNPRGVLIEAESGFFELLLNEWPAWRRKSSLPKELLHALTQQLVYQGNTVVVNAQPLGSIVRVHIRALNALDKLGKKQRNIALRYAHGESYHDIAHKLGLADSTVRNHIAIIFKKCHVHNKIELAALVQKYS